MAEETPILNEPGAEVTTRRAVIGGTTYAIANITSVRVTEAEPSWAGPAFLFVIGAVCLIAGVAQVRSESGAGWYVVAVAAALVGGGIAWARSLAPTYAVVLATAGAEQHAMETKDKQQATRIASALSDAIVRGS